MDPASSPVFLLGLSTLTPGKSEALGGAKCFLRLDLELVSLPLGQGAALGPWGGLGVLLRCSGRGRSSGPRLSGGFNPSKVRGTRMPAHLVQLQLSQGVIRHSSPESHHLWKARERGLRLRANHLTDSRQAPCPGDDRCWCTQRAQENTAMAVELGCAPMSDCQIPEKTASEWSPLLRGTSCAHRRLGAPGSPSTRTHQSWQPHCPPIPVGP